MSAGTQGTYSILIQVKGATEGKASLDQIATSFTKLDSVAARSAGGLTRISGTQSQLAGSLNQNNTALNQNAISWEKYNTATQKTVSTSSAISGSLGQVRGALGQLNSQINTTAATLPKSNSSTTANGRG